MVTPENELVKRFELFADTELLSQQLYDITHNGERSLMLGSGDIYTLMEARDNLEGLYDLCRSFVVAQMGREHKVKYGYDPVAGNDET